MNKGQFWVRDDELKKKLRVLFLTFSISNFVGQSKIDFVTKMSALPSYMYICKRLLPTI